LPRHQRGALWRAQNRNIPVARRALMSLPLVATTFLAGPANAAGPRPADHHVQADAKAASLPRSATPTTTSAATRSHQTNASGSHKTLPANRTTRTSGRISGHTDSKPSRSSRTARQTGKALAAGKTASRAKTANERTAPAHTTSAPHATLPGPTRHLPRPQAVPAPPARVPLGTFMVTCYDLYGHTADGAIAGPESVAVDPSVIALGTTIYVPGIGERTADDTGGMIIGDHIDIWEPTYGACANWGVRYVPIYRVG